MTYDSAMPTDWLYGAVVRQQTSELARRLDGLTSFVGVPTYDEFNPDHWRAEITASGIKGVRLGLADTDESRRSRVGVAIYAEWTTDAEEWPPIGGTGCASVDRAAPHLASPMPVGTRVLRMKASMTPMRW